MIINFILFFIFILIGAIVIPVAAGAKIFGIILVLLNLILTIIYMIPLTALIKRRLVDLIPAKANLLFILMMIAFGLSYILTLTVLSLAFSLTSTIPEMANPMIIFIMLILNLISSVASIGFTVGLIVLMCKKGNL